MTTTPLEKGRSQWRKLTPKKPSFRVSSAPWLKTPKMSGCVVFGINGACKSICPKPPKSQWVLIALGFGSLRTFKLMRRRLRTYQNTINSMAALPVTRLWR
eukprot:gnl/TRDRNA2_/TRDRNA2_146871_c0_seq1.p2 gnl/TRDRNA2_/TRDRNA2_146871_c0~~gnl/TRDRNA2_/TRDRNA2_146871_c0_seq1.p2  ORF type:complete len:101 (+),score=9.89 gnl/TRDRNA2_/TRDRNA2_146871_c0_seq1:91-393(+)